MSKGIKKTNKITNMNKQTNKQNYRNCTLSIWTFSYSKGESRDFKIQTGNSTELISFLSNIVYDGGTSLSSLELSR